jgi:dTDP-4-dehydrorhamnose 3,5-epimerase
MRLTEMRLPGVLLLEPRVFRDGRGFFVETWNRERYAAAGLEVSFVQDNVSSSRRGVLRGLHFQNPTPQGKLVSVLHGAVFDVAVDLRVGSPTFAGWLGVDLSADNLRQLYIPEGFAHGFLVTSDTAVFSYKCTAPYAPEYERSVRWDDPKIGIEWPIDSPILSPKDAAAPRLQQVAADDLFAAKAERIDAVFSSRAVTR